MALNPWAKMLSSTVTMTASLMVVSPGKCNSCSRYTSPRTIEARPRGPNQPMKITLAALRRVPMSAIATGSIRTTVRLRTAYSQSTALTCDQLRTTTRPKRKNTERLSSCPHSSANSTLCLPASLNPICTARPATKAAMNMLAPSISDTARQSSGSATTPICWNDSAIHPLRRARRATSHQRGQSPRRRPRPFPTAP